ncbi:MAG: phospholipid/cholesterol/gamma-HCH transport system substrate-binding protein [Streptosporangiaceae bacterium]|jgi:phospholipid/cholesterol/gamma-HCH transport system substrate-binding protein|nr:virulence factor Mce family protein [Streptosporangiaceae bacterium]MDX6434851.1 phospholipid/cholesterol/gamma-HCH transport system substrate-binding protein [Streptosporangiaceae bacterium]
MMNSDLSPRSRRLFRLIGAGAVAAAVVASYLGVRAGHPGSTYLIATFGRAGQGLDSQSDVKIRGINVGNVSSVKLTKEGRVQVKVRLNHGIRAPRSTVAAIEPLSVFGPKFVNLEPGSGENVGPYLADGATIGRTQDPQELTDIAAPTYNLLSAVDPQDLATLLQTFSGGLNGRGPQLSNTIDNAAKLLDLSARNSGNLKTLIANGRTLSATFAGRGGEIVNLAHNVNTLAPVLSDDPARLSALLTQGGQVSQQVTAILASDPQGPGTIIDRLLPALDISYRGRANTPSLISGVGGFFNQSAGILQVDGPHGTLLGTETIHVDLTNPVCTFVLGLCGPYPKPLPYPKIGGRK